MIKPDEVATAASGSQPRIRAAAWRNLTDGSSSADQVAHPNPAINRPQPCTTVKGAQVNALAKVCQTVPMTMVTTPTTIATQPDALRRGVIARLRTTVAPSELLNIAA